MSTNLSAAAVGMEVQMNSQLVFPKFDDYPTVTAEEVREFESRHQLSLPEDYADFLVRRRGSLPMFQNERGEHMCAEFNVDWGDKPARVSGPIVHMECTFSLFDGKNIKSAFESGYDLDDNILWNEHLHPPGLLPIGSNAGNSLFMLGVNEANAGKVFFLSTFHIPCPMSYDHIGFIADSFTAFLAAARPMQRDN